MVDIHCHILPGVDDGPRTWEIAQEMCQMAAADGITHLVATPHANSEFDFDRAACQEALERLRELSGGEPELSLGCDFHYSYENLQDLLASPESYTINGGNYLLLELSDFSIPSNFGDRLLELGMAGLRPILTHPERNVLLQRRPETMLHWVAGGCLIQVTGNALTGRWGRAARNTVRWLLDRDAVHVVASDAHNTTSRPPQLSPACTLLAKWKGEERAQMLLEENPAAIVAGKAVPYFPALVG
jgi:protein-tyrosine phosphatase